MSEAGIPVKISLQTRIDHGDDKEMTELIVFGHYYEKGETSYLIYDEVVDDGSVHTIVKFQRDSAQIIRRGAVNMRLGFREKGQSGGTFQTEAGTFLLKTVTSSINFEWDRKNKQGIIEINYHFFMEQIEAGIYQLSFNFKEAH